MCISGALLVGSAADGGVEAQAAAPEELAEGEALHSVAPFWRLIDPDSKVAARLTIDSEWIAAQRAAEQVV